MTETTANDSRVTWRLAALHLVALSSFAVAQPLLDLLGRNPEFFVARRSSTADIVLFAILVIVIPSAVVLAIAAVARFGGERVWRPTVVVLVGLLAALVVLPIAKRALDDSPRKALAIALVAGGVVALLYLRAVAARLFLTFLIPAPVFFLVLFLLVSPTSRLVLPQDAKGQAITFRVRATAPVVMIVGDEFATGALMSPDHQIDARRFPNFAALAQDSTWYRNSTTVNDDTKVAVPAILTGNRPAKTSLPIASDHPNNLFRWLSTSYELNVHEAITQVCPEKVCASHRTAASFDSRFRSLAEDTGLVYVKSVLPSQWTRSLPAIDQGWGNFVDNQNTKTREDERKSVEQLEILEQQTRFDAFIESLHRSSKPRLDFLHVIMPHVPLNRLPDGQRVLGARLTAPGLDPDSGSWTEDADYATTLQLQRYLLYLEDFDRELGRVTDKLRALGTYDDALIVVTADHGVSFLPGTSRRAVSRANASDILPQPLIIKEPHQREGRLDDRNVQSVDILPTIADLLDERLPFKVDGRSALSARMPATKHVTGNSHIFDVPAVLPSRFRIADLVATLIPYRDDQFDIYAQGPHAGLAGRSIASFPHGGSVQRGLVVENEKDIRDPDPERGLPVFINGTLGRTTAGETVVVALNGTVAGIGETFVEDGTTKLAVIVPPGLLKARGNEMRVYLLQADGSLVEVT